MIAGGIEGVITYPTEYVKTQLQIRKNAMSPIQFLRQTVRERGIFALYKGLGPLVIGLICVDKETLPRLEFGSLHLKSSKKYLALMGISRGS